MRKPGLWWVMQEVDDALLAWTRSAVEWVTEWFSVARSRQEQALLAVWLVGRLGSMLAIVLKQDSFALGFETFLTALLAFQLWRLHRIPLAARRTFAMDWVLRLFMVAGTQWMVGGSCAAPLARQHLWAWSLRVHSECLCLFLYVFASAGDGQPGRRRKIALTKLKEWFGAEWLPGLMPPLPEVRDFLIAEGAAAAQKG